MTTEPADLTNVGWDGNIEETHQTNALAGEKGFPARTQDGALVLIVSQRHQGTLKVLTDADGNEYVDDGPTGMLTPYGPTEPPAEPVDDSADATVDGHPVVEVPEALHEPFGNPIAEPIADAAPEADAAA